MVIELIASKEYNWKPDIIESDDKYVFIPEYNVCTEAISTPLEYKSKFADLPTSGMWEDQTESDDTLLGKLGGEWSGFTSE